MKSFLRRKQAQVIAALVMATAVGTMVVGLGLSNGIAGAASLPNSYVQQVPLTKTNRDCFGTVVGEPLTETFGSVIFNETVSGKLIAVVKLRNALPNHNYLVRLIQTPSGSGCDSTAIPLTTDNLGNGDANIQVAVLPGTKDAFVAVNNTENFGDCFTSEEVFF